MSAGIHRLDVLAQSQRAPGFALVDGVAQDGIVALAYLRMTQRMVQVNGQRLELQVAPAYSGVVQARGNLIVFPPPAHKSLIEAVDPDEIAFPVGLVATADGALPGALFEDQPAQ